MNIPKRQDLLILIDDVAGDFFVDYAAEKAVGHAKGHLAATYFSNSINSSTLSPAWLSIPWVIPVFSVPPCMLSVVWRPELGWINVR
jgi:hypothetical protein